MANWFQVKERKWVNLDHARRIDLEKDGQRALIYFADGDAEPCEADYLEALKQALPKWEDRPHG